MMIRDLGRQDFLPQAPLFWGRALISVAVGVIFCLHVFAAPVEITPGAGICEISSSSRVPGTWVLMTQSLLNETFGLSCQLQETPVADPFHEVNQRAESLVLWFWLDKDPRSEDLVLRVFDRESGYQFGMRKLAMHQMSDSSAQHRMNGELQAIMGGYPFVGVIQGGEVALWAPEESLDVAVATRDRVVRHPFLPQILEFKTRRGQKGQSVATVSGPARRRTWMSRPHFELSSKRQWLVRSEQR